jgi:hypothetical protein
MRERGDSHKHNRDDEPVRDPEFGREPMDLESALIQRLRTMEWPKPTEEQRERCLREIMKKMEEQKVEAEKKSEQGDQGEQGDQFDQYDATRLEVRREDRYPMTRRVNDNRYSSTRFAAELRPSPISTPRRASSLVTGY